MPIDGVCISILYSFNHYIIMKSGGFRLFLTLGLVVLALYNLYPTVAKFFKDQEIANLPYAKRGAALKTDEYRGLQDGAIKLGLDLQGGLQTTLEVGVEQLVYNLATEKDAAFDKAYKTAAANVKEDEAGFVAAFVAEFEKNDPNGRLSRYFRNEQEGITRRSSNADIAAYLNRQADAAIDGAISVIRGRVDRFGVTEPTIAKVGQRRISVEVPGLSDPARLRKLLKGTAQLEFRLTADQAQTQSIASALMSSFQTTTPADTTKKGDKGGTKNAFAEIFSPVAQMPVIGQALVTDTAKVNAMLKTPAGMRAFPADVVPMWTSASSGKGKDGKSVYSLLAIKKTIEIKGDVITAASVQNNPLDNRPEVSMSMNNDGAFKWASLTGANVGKPVAVVMDNVVFSYPQIREKISGGRTSINGLNGNPDEGITGAEEAADIVTVLKSGSLPAPVRIIEDRTIGATLGASFVTAGMLTLLVSLLVVAIFMVFYYKSGGFIAIAALLMNVILLFGVMISIKSTLSLPGIAGIVLTVGMAVDSNVLIFERIREELDAGRNLKAATDAGYAKAFWAIFDSNITTLLMAIILGSFGVGPIKGFAVTLGIGILTTMFTTLVFGRMITDMLNERKVNLTYG